MNQRVYTKACPARPMKDVGEVLMMMATAMDLEAKKRDEIPTADLGVSPTHVSAPGRLCWARE